MRALPLRVCTDYFPAEPGRRPLGCAGDPLEGVWPTNSLRATGGYLAPEVLPHSENYYALRPPRLVAFWCERAPWLGGETALFDGAGALAALPPALRVKLDAPFAVRRLLSEERLHRRHATQAAALLRACSEEAAAQHRGVEVRRHLLGEMKVEMKETMVPLLDHLVAKLVGIAAPPQQMTGVIELRFEKPAVLAAPPLAAPLPPQPPPPGGQQKDAGACMCMCARPALVLNFGEIGSRGRDELFSGLLRRGLFAGSSWSVHRMLWMLALRAEPMRRALLLIDQAPGWLRHPFRMLRLLRERRALAAAQAAATTQAAAATRAALRADGGAGSRRHGTARQRRLKLTAATSQRPTLAEALDATQGEQLGRALAQHASLFAWAQGDVLLIDNARVLHDGMPGLGRRRLRVMLLGELPLPQAPSHAAFLDRVGSYVGGNRRIW